MNNLKFSMYKAACLSMCAGLLASNGLGAMGNGATPQSSAGWLPQFMYPSYWTRVTEAAEPQPAVIVEQEVVDTCEQHALAVDSRELLRAEQAAYDKYVDLAEKNPLVELEYASALFASASFKNSHASKIMAFKVALDVFQVFHEDAACFTRLRKSTGELSDFGLALNGLEAQIEAVLVPMIAYLNTLPLEQQKELYSGFEAWSDDAVVNYEDQEPSAVSASSEWKPVKGSRRKQRRKKAQSCAVHRNTQQAFELEKHKALNWLLEYYAHQKVAQQFSVQNLQDTTILVNTDEFIAKLKADTLKSRLNPAINDYSTFDQAKQEGRDRFSAWLTMQCGDAVTSLGVDETTQLLADFNI